MAKNNNRKITTPQSLNAYIKSICDIMRRSGKAGAASKTNLLFFKRGEPTKEIWYFDLSDLNVLKKQPLTLAHFDEFFKLFQKRADSERSWRVHVEDIENKNYDLKAVNPNRKIRNRYANTRGVDCRH